MDIIVYQYCLFSKIKIYHTKNSSQQKIQLHLFGSEADCMLFKLFSDKAKALNNTV